LFVEIKVSNLYMRLDLNLLLSQHYLSKIMVYILRLHTIKFVTVDIGYRFIKSIYEVCPTVKPVLSKLLFIIYYPYKKPQKNFNLYIYYYKGYVYCYFDWVFLKINTIFSYTNQL